MRSTIYMRLVIYLVLSAVVSLALGQSTCRFAFKYTTASLLADQAVRGDFLDDVVEWESNFIHQVGVENSSGFTYDGQRVDYDTGQLLPNDKHMFSASSKESLHLAILAKVLEGNIRALKIYSLEQALDIIAKKVNTYEDFNSRYPGFGGWMPWIVLNGSNKVEPTWDFKNRTPSLDNGQLFWAAAALNTAWQTYHMGLDNTLRLRFWNATGVLMLKNLKRMFFNETTGKLRAEASIQDITLPPQNNTYSNSVNYYLDDPYEGQLVAMMATLLSEDFTDREISNIWVDKRNKLVAVNYTIVSLGKNITVERGYWYSAHQQWKRLFMPYDQSPTYQVVSSNGEKARVWNSRDNDINGLYAATTGTVNSNMDPLEYFADCGIPSVASQKVTHLQQVTPYGSYPVVLKNLTYGIVWYHNMLMSPSGQTKYGSLEATNVTGANVSPMLTWDTKITTLLALMGGTTDLIRKFLADKRVLVKFTNRIETEYSIRFGNIVGQDIEMVGPKSRVVAGKADFTSCQAAPNKYQQYRNE